MIRFVRDFVKRWKWLLAVQLVVSSASWIFFSGTQLPAGRGQATLQHFEYAAAIALSWDLMRGQCRACLALPLSGGSLASGFWLAVVIIGPMVSCLALVPNAVYSWIAGRPLPSWSEISLHAVISLLLGGSLQFVLSGLPGQPSRTAAGKVRDGFFAVLWGLSIAAPGWLGLVFPSRWKDLQAGGKIAMGCMALAALASCFTTPRMVRGRSLPAVAGGPEHKNPGTDAETGAWAAEVPVPGLPGPSPRSPGGWKVWLGLELRWMLFLPLMALVILSSLRLMGSFSSSGARTAIESYPTQYSSLGALCAMMVIPMFSLSCGSVRAFAALPVRREMHALLMALRPPVYCVSMFSAAVLLSWAMGRPLGNPGIAACAFVFIGSVTSLLQPLLIRWPSFPAALGMGMVLTPSTLLLLPYSFKDHTTLVWMPAFSLAFLLISAALHRRVLRTSSKIYRSLPWLQRQAPVGVAR